MSHRQHQLILKGQTRWPHVCVQDYAGIRQLLPLYLFLFCSFVYREVLMDITDEEGDREAGVWTIPVVAGQLFRVMKRPSISLRLQHCTRIPVCAHCSSLQ